MGRLKDLIFKKKYSFWDGHYDELPFGWRIAFGEELSKELLHIVKKFKLKDFVITQVARNQGRLILKYKNGNLYIDELKQKYSIYSMGFCIHCGQKASYKHKNLYMCVNCFRQIYLKGLTDIKLRRNLVLNSRIRVSDIPEDTYGVDLRKLWGFKPKN